MVDKKKNDNIITLKHPLTNGDNKIDSITLRKPMAGELRGIKLLDVMQMDWDSYGQLLPRIASPVLTEQQINQIDPSDMLPIMSIIAGFFEGSKV